MSTFEPWLRLTEPPRAEPGTNEVVSRWVESPPPNLAGALHHLADRSHGERVALGRGDELQLDGPFERSSDRAVPTWWAPGRLVWHGPTLVRVAHVQVAVTAWSSDAAEVSVRPAGRRVLAWGARRERRYFDSAHRAAAHIAHVVAAPAGDVSTFESTSAA